MNVYPYWTAQTPRTELRPVRTVAPSEDAVTLDAVKLHCDVDFVDDDEKLRGLLAAAIAYVDGYDGVLGRALVTQTWKVNLCQWPSDLIRLPLAPVQSITTIKYYDSSNVLQTYSPTSNYALYEDALSPYVGYLSTITNPTGIYNRLDAVEVTFVAGYGLAKAVPESIKLAIKMLTRYWYDIGHSVVAPGAWQDLPMTVQALLSPYRRMLV